MRTKILYQDIRTRGCTSPDGTRLNVFSQRGQEWFVARKVFICNPAAAIASLAEQGFLVGGAGCVAQLIEQVREVRDFPDEEVLMFSGWNGALFARADGEVLTPTSASDFDVPGVAYVRNPHRNRREGRRSAWLEDIAPAILADQLITTLACSAFAAMTRPFHSLTVPGFTLEMVASQGSGVLRRYLLTATGSMVPDVLATDPLARVVADPARFIAASRDELLVLGDFGDYLCGGSDNKRKAGARALVFDHLTSAANGEANATGLAAPHAVIIGDRSLSELLDLDALAVERFRDKVLTIEAPAETLERLRGADASSGFASAEVYSRLPDSYGHALYEFQQRLVDKRSTKGLTWLRVKLDADFDEFCSHAAEDGTGDLPASIVHSFAVLHAAFRMAARLGVFPESARGSNAVWKVYRRYVRARPRALTAADVITAVAELPGVLLVDDLDEEQGQEELQDVPAFIKTIGSEKRELWVLTAQKKASFDWPVFSKLADFGAWYVGKGEKDRAGTKRVIGGWKNARVLRFRIP